MTIPRLAGHLGAQRIEPVPIPHDCRDGFLAAYWRRPHAYLDPRGARRDLRLPAAARPPTSTVAVARLRADLESGEWARRNADHPRARRARPRLPARIVADEAEARRAKASVSRATRRRRPPASAIRTSVSSVGHAVRALVRHEPVDQPRRRAPTIPSALSGTPACSMKAAVGPLSTCPPTSGETATTGAGRRGERLAQPGHGEHRPDRDHRVRGADDDRPRGARARRAPRASARRASAPRNSTPSTGPRPPRRIMNSWNGHQRPVRPHVRAHRVVARGQHPRRHAQRARAPRRSPRSAARPPRAAARAAGTAPGRGRRG